MAPLRKPGEAKIRQRSRYSLPCSLGVACSTSSSNVTLDPFLKIGQFHCPQSQSVPLPPIYIYISLLITHKSTITHDPYDWIIQPELFKTVMGFLSLLSLMPSLMRCALWCLLSIRLHIIVALLFASSLFLFSFSFSLLAPQPPSSPLVPLYFCLSDHASICLSVPPMCCLCVYTCDERHWIICTTGENGWSCN